MLARALLSAALATTLLAAQTVTWVDATRGVDQPGGGSATAPFRTLSYAVGQARAQPNPVFRLRRGTYDDALGEVFPIDLPDVCTVEADPVTAPAGSGEVRLVAPLALGATLRLTPSTAAAAVTLRDLRMSGGMFRGVQVLASAAGTVHLAVERCAITQSRCVAVNASPGARVVADLVDCVLRGPDLPVLVNADGDVELTLERCSVESGVGAALRLDASGGGSIAATARCTRIGRTTTRGIQALTDAGGRIAVRVEHCLLHDVARTVIGNPAGIGALTEHVGAGAMAPQWTVVNSVFTDNRADAQAGTATNYTWGANLVEQSSLGALGGNLIGRPSFVDAARDDFHLLPASLGRDLGRIADTTAGLDLDGDPRAAGVPDLGPDEVHPLYVEAARPAVTGSRWTLRALGPAQQPFALAIADDAIRGSFGAGRIHLAGTIYPLLVAGSSDSRGVGETTLTVPASPWLIGRTLAWQSLWTQPPYLGSNALRAVLTRP